MSIKTKLDTTDQDTTKVDYQLFATVDDAIKDVKIDEQTVIKIKITDEHDEK